MEVHGMVNTGTLQTWRDIAQTMWTKRRGHQGKVGIEAGNRLMQRRSDRLLQQYGHAYGYSAHKTVLQVEAGMDFAD